MVTKRAPDITSSEAGPSDRALMASLAAGELDALGELYLRFGPDVCGVLGRMLPRALLADVDDLCQDVFLDVKDLAKRYEERGSLRAWLLGIAVQKARNYRRKQWVRSKLLREQPPRRGWGKSATPEGAGGIATRLDVQAAMEDLSQSHREVLVLHVVMGLTAEEISSALGIRPGSVWSRIHRARRALTDGLSRREAMDDRERES